eukprot:Lithocolla_globosa_v1_NODE_2847_length_1849_cov_547.481048.p3 type:complete len:104 gc:universal NODE_2847_length_1849_cov_547.481048:476-165(-)
MNPPIPLNPEMTRWEISFTYSDRPFETDWARIKPFLNGKARVRMGEAIEPYYEHVKYCHTDSMITDIKLPVKTGNNLGDLVYEGYCEHAIIVNSNQKTGQYII